MKMPCHITDEPVYSRGPVVEGGREIDLRCEFMDAYFREPTDIHQHVKEQARALWIDRASNEQLGALVRRQLEKAIQEILEE